MKHEYEALVEIVSQCHFIYYESPYRLAWDWAHASAVRGWHVTPESQHKPFYFSKIRSSNNNLTGSTHQRKW